MIIKKWSGSAWEEQFPKTKSSMIYAADGATQVFDGGGKIKAAYLPDVAFQGLRPAGAVNATNNTLAELLDLAQAKAAADGGTPEGCFFVASSTTAISAGEAYHEIQGSGGEEGVTGTSFTMEANDWIILTEIDTSGANDIHRWSIVNNQYVQATVSQYGVVKLGSNTVQGVGANSVSATASRTYAIQLNGSGQLVVNVPWQNTQVGVTSVPTDGNTTQPISSDWAYDHLNNAEAHPRDTRNQIAGSYASGSHDHGAVLNDGTMNSTRGISNGDNIVIRAGSDNKLFQSSIAFATVHGNEYLRKDGTWGVPVDTNTNTQLTQEQVEDYVGGMVVNGNGINFNYVDGAGQIVADMQYPIVWADDLSGISPTVSNTIGFEY